METKQKHISDTKWFSSFTIFHNEVVHSMADVLKPSCKKELISGLRQIIGGVGTSEVVFSNPSITAIAKYMVMFYCDEWYCVMPQVMVTGGGYTLRVEWANSVKKIEEIIK